MDDDYFSPFLLFGQDSGTNFFNARINIIRSLSPLLSCYFNEEGFHTKQESLVGGGHTPGSLAAAVADFLSEQPC